jgi:intraflagellar transport protein 172
LLISGGFVVQAIAMYKTLGQYNEMIRLVKKFHPDLEDKTHAHLGAQLEADGLWAQVCLPFGTPFNIKIGLIFLQAEQHYVQGDEWRSALAMYRKEGLWEDAYRVAKKHGGQSAGQQVAYLWAQALGGDSAVKLLTKFGMVETAVQVRRCALISVLLGAHILVWTAGV